MTYHVAGLDLSLSNTGVAVARGGSPVTVHNVTSGPSKSIELEDGTTTASLLDRRDRLQHLAARVIRHALAGYNPEVDDAPLFVVEAPLYRAPMVRDPKTNQLKPLQGGGHAHDRAGLWWLVTHLLFKQGFVVEVSTTTMKRYATGTGGGKKVGVLRYAALNFPHLLALDDNASDAVALCAMGARQLGHPLEPSVQRVTPAALASVNWPSSTQRRNHA